MKPLTTSMTLTAAAAFVLVWACSGPADQHETICDNNLDDDADGLIDCMDPDCSGFRVCAADGDGDVDSDSDTDTDTDTDSDADGDTENCALDCPRPGTSPLLDLCQRGDCYDSGETRDCCVSGNSLCATTISVGTLYEGLEVDWRGFYENDHECQAELLESLGAMRFRYTIQTRGEACEYGFIRVHVNANVDVLEVGTEYALCDDPTIGSLDLTVNVTVGEPAEQINYTNTSCEIPGTFTLTRVGSEAGAEYDFDFSGRLSEIDTGTGDFTGEVVDISVDSEGLVASVTLEE